MIVAGNLHKSFGARKALNGLSFAANNGSITGLVVGPNGCGKTTTLRLIAGLLWPDRGQAQVDGIDPSHDPVGARRRLVTWRALGQSNAAFLDLSLRRCRRELRAIHHGRWALAAALSIVMGWLSPDAFLHRLPVGPYLLGIAINVLIAAIWLAIFTTRERRAIREFEQLSQFADRPPE